MLLAAGGVLAMRGLYGAERPSPLLLRPSITRRRPVPRRWPCCPVAAFGESRSFSARPRRPAGTLGYAGGERSTAQYETVSSGSTGHAESVRITFNPAEFLGQLLKIFFSIAHDPTQLNRQFPDVGTQYRSAIFYADEAQKRIAEAYIAQLNRSRSFPSPIVTRVDLLKGFYPAEDYHQDYLTRYPTNPYIARFDVPKVENLKHTFPALYAERPVLALNR